jgi:hypothetical protein
VKKNFARCDHDSALNEPRLQIYRHMPVIASGASGLAVQIFLRIRVAKCIGG